VRLPLSWLHVTDDRTLRALEHVVAYARAHDELVSLRAVVACCAKQAGADGGWITSGQGCATATDDLAVVLEELHFELGEGPAEDTADGPLAVDLTSADASRWPVFAHHAITAGARSVLTLPMWADTVLVGVLCLFARRTTVRFAPDLAGFAELAASLLLDHRHEPDDVDRWLGDDRAEVHQATGMIAIQLGVGVTEALSRLRAHAFAADKPVVDVAREILARQLRFLPENNNLTARRTRN
jgi:ANTAR domain-containing protein